jgi:hypothetical protein
MGVLKVKHESNRLDLSFFASANFLIILQRRRTQSCINLQSESARADALLAESDG